MNRFFGTLSSRIAQWTGTTGAFALALLVCLTWAATGPYFHFSDTWQLVINTGTTIVTFLMVFLIQNTQNRDTRALHLKLDELIRAVGKAHNEMIDIESLDDEHLKALATRYKEMRARCLAKKLSPAGTHEDE